MFKRVLLLRKSQAIEKLQFFVYLGNFVISCTYNNLFVMIGKWEMAILNSFGPEGTREDAYFLKAYFCNEKAIEESWTWVMGSHG